LTLAASIFLLAALAQPGKRQWADRLILIPSLMLEGVLALMFTKGYWIA
jgi:hypothetical protein